MKSATLPLLGALSLGLAGCSSDSSGSATPGEASNRPSATTSNKPLLMDQSPVQEPSSFDGRTHVLNVTVRDLEGFAYIKDSEGRCVAEDPPEKALIRAMPTLVVRSARSEKVLAKVRGPVVGENAVQGKPCEARFTITVPYRSKYRLGLTSAYHGIADPSDPPPPVVVTKGEAQNVLYIY